jgi:hypothetical protein
VTFEVGTSRDGRPKAVDVTIVGAPNDSRPSLPSTTSLAYPRRTYRRTAHAAARRFGLQRRGRPLREFQSSSAKVFALELQARNTAMDNLSLIPRPGSLALTWRIRFFDAWQLSQQPVQRTFSNIRGTW